MSWGNLVLLGILCGVPILLLWLTFSGPSRPLDRKSDGSTGGGWDFDLGGSDDSGGGDGGD